MKDVVPSVWVIEVRINKSSWEPLMADVFEESALQRKPADERRRSWHETTLYEYRVVEYTRSLEEG